MPNWTYNTLKISGEKTDIENFIEVAFKPDNNGELSFSFENIFPMPLKLKNTISPSSSAKGRKWMNEDKASVREIAISEVLGEDSQTNLIPVENNTDEKCALLRKEYNADNWYDWNLKSWGTKWDVEVLKSNCIIDEEEIILDFNTAWSPPEAFLQNLQQKYQNLDIRLHYTSEGSDHCGLFGTIRDGDKVYLDFCEDELIYKASDGSDIYYDNNDGEWKYSETNQICEDYISINPFE